MPWATSNVSSRELEATKVTDATFAGDGSLSGGMALVAAAVETMLKDSMDAEKNCYGDEGDEERMGMKPMVLKRTITPNSSLSLRIFPLWQRERRTQSGRKPTREI